MDSIIVKKETFFKKNSKNEDLFISYEDFNELRDLQESFSEYSKSQFLASNAHFVYLFALFNNSF